MIRQIFAALVFIPSTVVIASMIVVGGVFRFPRTFMDWLSRAFGFSALVATLTRVKHVVLHSQPETWPKNVVLVSNHESHLDGPAIQTTLTARSIRYVAKEALFKIPFLGWGLRAAGNVAVSRQGSKSDHARLNEAKERDNDGDVLFFAEGTRSREGSFQAFKKGAFYFAIIHKRPIVPIAACGGFESMKPGALRPKGGAQAVCVGEVIDVSHYTLSDIDALREKVRIEVGKLRLEALRLIESPRLDGPVSKPIPMRRDHSISFSA